MIEFFKQFPEVTAVMSEKSDGSMRLSDDNSNLENRFNFFRGMGISENKVVSAPLAHGIGVAVVSNNKEKVISATDGLVAGRQDVFLSVTVADCVPVFFYDPEHKIIGIAHAGWRGVAGNIVGEMVRKISGLGGMADNLKIFLGPGINSCHFEVKADVAGKFRNYGKHVINRDGGIFVDLKGIIMEQLREAGIKKENIEDNGECTFENKEKYFSFRRDKPAVVEAMVALIGIKKE